MTILEFVLRLARSHPRIFLLLTVVAWLALYQPLGPVAGRLAGALPVDPASRVGSALRGFLYDTPKVPPLTGVVFVMGMINSHFTPERTRTLLAGRTEGLANAMPASLGIVTPFCSCSAVPLFSGFVQAGIPLGVTCFLLISAPMVNEVALALLFGLFVGRIALLYPILGLAVAIVVAVVLPGPDSHRLRRSPLLRLRSQYPGAARVFRIVFAARARVASSDAEPRALGAF